MALVESIAAIFDRLLMPRIAATAALASLILLSASVGLILWQIRTQLLHPTDPPRQGSSSGAKEFEIVDILTPIPEITAQEFFTTILPKVNRTLATAAATFLIIFATSCCSLVVELMIAAVRLLKGSLSKLIERLNRDLRKIERLQRSKPKEEEDEDLKRFVKVVRAVYPYLLISFDLFFYLCLAVVAVPVIFVLLMLSLTPISYVFPIIAGIVIILIGWGILALWETLASFF
jgi:hypothetical protein